MPKFLNLYFGFLIRDLDLIKYIVQISSVDLTWRLGSVCRRKPLAVLGLGEAIKNIIEKNALKKLQLKDTTVARLHWPRVWCTDRRSFEFPS